MLVLHLQAFNLSLLHINLLLSLSGILGSLFSLHFIKLTLASILVEVAADDADDWLCLACPPNIVTKHPKNFVKDSSSGEDCYALWAIAS